jgi:hypothetical protein
MGEIADGIAEAFAVGLIAAASHKKGRLAEIERSAEPAE